MCPTMTCRRRPYAGGYLRTFPTPHDAGLCVAVSQCVEHSLSSEGVLSVEALGVDLQEHLDSMSTARCPPTRPAGVLPPTGFEVKQPGEPLDLWVAFGLPVVVHSGPDHRLFVRGRPRTDQAST
jgi:hypothetical protein